MKVESNIAVGINSEGATYLKAKTYPIIDWNMDSNASFALAHGLGADFLKIRAVFVMIRTDGLASMYNFQAECTSVYNTKLQAGIANIDNTNINLYRVTGEHFDSTNFDSVGGFVRGYVTLLLEP